MKALELAGYVPFACEAADGLHVTERSATWVRLLRLGTAVFMVAADHEALDGEVEVALRRLVDRRRIRGRRVATNVQVTGSYVLEGPPAAEALGSWVAQKLSVNTGSSDNILRSRFVPGDDAVTSRALVAAASQQSVETRLNLLRECGVDPCLLYGAPFDLAAAFATSPEHASGVTALVCASESGVAGALTYHGAAMDGFFGEVDASLEAAVDESRLELTLRSERAGLPIGRWVRVPAEDETKDPVRFSLRGEEAAAQAVPAGELACAVSYAMLALFPGLGGLDFLDPSVSERAQAAAEGRLLRRTAVGVGAIGGFVIVVFVLLSLFLTWQARRAELQLDALGPQLARVTSLEERRVELTEKFVAAQRALGSRTAFSAVTSELARLIPREIILDQMHMATDSGSIYTVTVRGGAPSEREVARLMSSLEAVPSSENVRLLESKRSERGKAKALPVEFELQALTRNP